MSLEKLEEWIGRTQSVEDLAAPFPVRALAATLDEGDPDPEMAIRCRPLALALLPGDRAAIEDRARWPRRARRLPAAGAAAPPHVGRQPLHLRRRASTRRRDDRTALHDQIRRTQDRLDRLDGVRHRAAHDLGPTWRVIGRGTRHRLPRGRQARRKTEAAESSSDRSDLAQDDPGRSRAVVPLLCSHLQRPSHPLRPTLCHRD